MAPSINWKLKMLNLAGMAYFLAFASGALLIGCLVTLPDLYAEDPQTLFGCRVAGIYIYVIVLLNWLCLVYFHKHSLLSSHLELLPKFTPVTDDFYGHRSCRTCGVVSPPRAKHCPLCQDCVIKRDHHCFFGGCCVGFYNQRYFTVFCFYSSVAAFYSTVITFTYLGTHFASLLSSQFYSYLFPWVLYYWVTGQTQLKIVAMVIWGYFSFMTSVASGFFFGWQCMLLTTGQTSYEWQKGVKRYRQPLLENIRSVFGPWGLLNFVVPMPFLKSPDNGFDWKLCHEE